MDDRNWSLSKDEIKVIEDAVSERHPSISWEVRPIYGYGVSLVGIGPDGISEAQYKVSGNRGKEKATLEDILAWSDVAAMVISDPDLEKDFIGDMLLAGAKGKSKDLRKFVRNASH